MKLTVLALTFALTVATGGFLFAQAADPASAPASYGTEISIEPAGENVFLLKAKVTDLASGQVVAGPALKMPAGQPVSTETTVQGTGDTFSLTASVDGATRTATYSVVAKRGGKVISEHTASIAL
jgi:hypothetical protein